MTKYILVAVIILALVALVGCVSQRDVVGEYKTYEITSDIKSLDININAADFVIEHSEKFSVESNLIYLSVSQEDGVLKIIENTKNPVSYVDAKLKLSIPDDVVFESVSIKTGASKLTAKTVSANNMKLKTGAGQVEFDCLNVHNSIDIKGGAGQINILDGTLNNLSLNLGVGELNMTAKLIGESDLKFGVGESDLTLIGSKDDYKFNVENGIGKITIDGESGAFFTNSSNGESFVKIKGGVGETNITFHE